VRQYKYDLALSYASENESIVQRVYKILTEEGFCVFFAPEYQHKLVGEDMVRAFYRIFRYEARYIAAFVSKEYIRKDATMQEANAALVRNSEEKASCLIPFYMDDSSLPGLDSDVIYRRTDNPAMIASLIKQIIKDTRGAAKDKSHIDEAKGTSQNNINIVNNNYGKQVVIGTMTGDINL